MVRPGMALLSKSILCCLVISGALWQGLSGTVPTSPKANALSRWIETVACNQNWCAPTMFPESDAHTVCPWKATTIPSDVELERSAAASQYPDPRPAAIQRPHRVPPEGRSSRPVVHLCYSSLAL